jgi:hypothetical protein
MCRNNFAYRSSRITHQVAVLLLLLLLLLLFARDENVDKLGRPRAEKLQEGTAKFAVDLGSGLHGGKWNVLCL